MQSWFTHGTKVNKGWENSFLNRIHCMLKYKSLRSSPDRQLSDESNLKFPVFNWQVTDF